MAQAIGILSQAVGMVTAVDGAGQERALASGDVVYEGDVITVAGTGSQADITFNNGCMMSLLEGESALIDETAYKLEFYDDAEIAIDLESAEGISSELAADDNEEMMTFDGDPLNEDEAIDLSELEDTAAGNENIATHFSQNELQERVDNQDNNYRSEVIDPEVQNTTDDPVTVSVVERGGEIVGDDTGVVVDTQEPVIPTIDVTIGGSDGYTNDNTPSFEGSGEPNTTIIVYDQNSLSDVTILGETTVSADGHWSYTPDPLLDGSHTISIESVDSAGNSSMNEGSAAFIIDTVTPDTPTISFADITNDATPLVSGEGSEGDTVTLNVGDQTYTTTVNDSGTWEMTLDPLSDGNHDLSVTLTDRAGNTSNSATGSFLVDTTAPLVPQINDIEMTGSTNATLSGSAEPQSQITVTVLDASQQIDVDEEGNWSVSLDNLGSGQNTVMLTAVDSSENVSASVYVAIIVTAESISFELGESEGETSQGLENISFHAVNEESNFDPNAPTLDLSQASSGDVSDAPQGVGVDDSEQHGNRAISGQEALIIELDNESQSVTIDIDKLNEHESGQWIVYDENMERIGDGVFSGDDINDDGQHASVTISQEDVDGAFTYIAITALDADSGQSSTFFIEDISINDESDSFNYNLTLSDVGDDFGANLYIEGLGEDVVLEDSSGNSIGSFSDGVWSLDATEVESLQGDDGSQLQIISNTVIDENDITLTAVDISYSQGADYASPLTADGGNYDFDSLITVQITDMSEDELKSDGLSLQDVLELSHGGTQLSVVSGDNDANTLSLDVNSWELRTDGDGNPVIIENEGNSFAVYSSTDMDNAFDLIVDEMITVVLES